MPRYSIITPTILRPSSVDSQFCQDWEHIIMVDGVPGEIPASIIHPQRKIFWCDRAHKNWGNTCRHNAWDHATGDYLYYLDDDNYFADDQALESLKIVTEDWAIFPILKPNWGGLHFFCPPMRYCSDSGGMIIKREFGRYPNIADYDADGQLVEQLRTTHGYKALLFRPLLIKMG